MACAQRGCGLTIAQWLSACATSALPTGHQGSGVDRVGGALVYESDQGVKVGTVNIADPAIARDPTPDLVAESPDGRFVSASLRRPNPLSGDPHASLGSTPGLLVIEVLQDGRGMAVRGLAPISNLDANGIERADGHGVQWRRK